MNKIVRIILWALGILVLSSIIAILIVKFNVLGKSKPDYVAVYLTTGDVYFGKLSGFNKFKLSDVVYIQKDSKGELSVQKFKDLIWKPQEPMYLNEKQVSFWTYLSSDSPIIQAIEGTIPAVQQSPAAQ